MIRRITIGLSLMCCAVNCYAGDILSQSYSQFFADEKNREAYQDAQASGKVEKLLKINRKRCDKMEGAEKQDCLCIAEAMAKVDGKIVYFESMRHYTRSRRLVAAKHNNDMEEYTRLKAIVFEPHPDLVPLKQACLEAQAR